MCGIAGIVGEMSDVNRAALAKMAQAMRHRGPDSTGVFESTPDARGRGCMMAHRRLSILDLSTAADQPMTDPHTKQTIVFNGEIYSFKTLRAQLQREGESFQSSGDTAVMLRLLSLRGHSAVAQLRGMFAFGLWDERARRLTIARDPLGIKPLYICRNPDPAGEWSLLFASEVRSILASGLLGKPRLNPRAVASVIWNGFVMGPETIVEGITSLRPGEIVVLDEWAREIVAQMYYTMPAGDEPKMTSDEELREALRESVELHLASDVPLGVFLSGGVDSSAVANLASKASDTPVNTFTLAFEEQAYSEGAIARQVAEAIGTTHHEITLTESRFAADIDTALGTLDQPTFDGLNSYYISKAVREAGLTVALVGTGGDELFGGYSSFRAIPSLLRWERRSRLMPASCKVLAATLAGKVLAPSKGNTPPQVRWAKLGDMVKAGNDIVALYQLAYALFLPDYQSKLLSEELRESELISGLPADLHARLRAEIATHSPLSATSVMEMRCFLGERLLRDTDAASMAVSLETRLPLVDSVLTGVVNGLPDDHRYANLGSKQLLRDAGLEGLDPALFNRPKSGFVMPFDQWIRKGLCKSMGEMMHDASAARRVGLNPRIVGTLWDSFQDNAPGLYWSRVWAIYVLMQWCQRHEVYL
jgi:asparagine synthase (glutamine-hydrolysing)